MSVLIVGSGIGGATAAFALAKRGIEVTVIERGAHLPVEPENWSPKSVFIDRRYKPSDIWLDGDGKEFAPGVHYLVGGNSKVYGASLPRFRESDFLETRHREGLSPAWPLNYSDLEPYYCEAESLYRVHGNPEDDPTYPPRSAPMPFPALSHDPYIEEVKRRLEQKGVHPVANAMGINWSSGSDSSCIRCKTCDGFPCKVGAKSDAEINALNPAIATGKVKLRTQTQALRILTNQNEVIGIEVQGPNGIEILTADKYVLAAGAVNTTALLLKSANDHFPTGVANRSDQVGRNFMMHNNAHIAAIDFRRKNDVVFQKTLSVNDWFNDGGNGYPLGTLQLIGKVQGIMMKSWATKVPLSLLDLFAKYSVEWLVMAEDLPSPTNRVTLTKTGKIQTTRRALGTDSHRELWRKSKSLLHSIGYHTIFTQWFDISMNSHQCGTTRAGTDPQTSVISGHLQSHDLPNLWLIDAGFFPSSGAMNPALTIAAMALRAVNESTLGET